MAPTGVYYSNPRVDALIDQARRELDPEQRASRSMREIQQILADELPYINLWYLDNVLVHSKRVRDIDAESRRQLRLSEDRRIEPLTV